MDTVMPRTGNRAVFTGAIRFTHGTAVKISQQKSTTGVAWFLLVDQKLIQSQSRFLLSVWGQ